MVTRRPAKPASSSTAASARKPARSPASAKPAASAQTPAAPQPAQAAKPAKAAKAPKPAKVAKAADKAKKPKLVRDSFTIPKTEYEAIAALKLRAAKLGQTPKKSELLRAGLKALNAMGDAALLASLAAVPSIKTGRPAA